MEIKIETELVNKLSYIAETTGSTLEATIQATLVKYVDEHDPDGGWSIPLAEFKQTLQQSSLPNLGSLIDQVESLLRSLDDDGYGVNISYLLEKLGNVDKSLVDDVLFELEYHRKVYQPRPDYYKINSI